MTKTIKPLALIVIVSWAMILLGSFVVFKLIVPIPDSDGYAGAIASAILKALLATIMVSLWLFILVKLRDAYVGRRLPLRKQKV